MYLDIVRLKTSTKRDTRENREVSTKEKVLGRKEREPEDVKGQSEPSITLDPSKTIEKVLFSDVPFFSSLLNLRRVSPLKTESRQT